MSFKRHLFSTYLQTWPLRFLPTDPARTISRDISHPKSGSLDTSKLGDSNRQIPKAECSCTQLQKMFLILLKYQESVLILSVLHPTGRQLLACFVDFQHYLQKRINFSTQRHVNKSENRLFFIWPYLYLTAGSHGLQCT